MPGFSTPASQRPTHQPPPLISPQNATLLQQVISGALMCVCGSILILGITSAGALAGTLMLLRLEAISGLVTDTSIDKHGDITLTVEGFYKGATRSKSVELTPYEQPPRYNIGAQIPLIVKGQAVRIKSIREAIELKWVAVLTGLLIVIIGSTTQITKPKRIQANLPRWFTDVWNKTALFTCVMIWAFLGTVMSLG